jgi:2-hydroxychromene-2-carboxylate isomerase
MSSAGFYYDIVCPYAYMAFSFLKKSGVFSRGALELKPILLGGLFKHMDVEQNPNTALSPQKAAYLRTDILRQADYFFVPLKFHARHPVKTVSAMRLLHACHPSQIEALTERLYKAYWQENLDIDDDVVIDTIAHDFAIGTKASYLDHAKSSLINATLEAFNRKVFGVPTIELNNRLYFGGDRLLLLEKELKISMPNAEWQKTDEIIDFYFDFSSPYSYLAWAEVKKARAAGVKFAIKPILLGALFRDVGTANIPMLSAHPNKTEYYFQDMRDWAHYRDIPFLFNSNFPIRSVTPLRVALVEEKAIDAIFTAAWAENLDVGDKAVLQNVLDEHGFSGQQLLVKTEEHAIKEQLKANTAEAIARGVFGVPSFFVKGNLVFGQDRFLWMRREL